MSYRLKNVVIFLKITICFLLSRPFEDNQRRMGVVTSPIVMILREKLYIKGQFIKKMFSKVAAPTVYNDKLAIN